MVAAANASAKSLSIHTGLRFPDAKARAPELVSEEIDRIADENALRRLAEWMIRIAPATAIDGVDGLMLETTGCERLYGGEAALLKTAGALLQRNQIPYKGAIAGTPGAASALARASDCTLLASGEEKRGLADLPVSALRISEDAQVLLRRFGLTRIGQLYDIDRKALARRFRSVSLSDAVLTRLDQALGLRQEPLSPFAPAPDFAARLPCPDPLITTEAIGFGLETLAEDLCDQLKNAGLGARSFILHAFRADGTKDHLAIATARGVNDPRHVRRLFNERIERINPDFGVDLLLLQGFLVNPMSMDAPSLSGALAGGDVDEALVSALADRITARLGEGTVTVSQHQERFMPEEAEIRAAFTGALPAPLAPSPATGPRPVRLFEYPERVTVLAEAPDGPPYSFQWRKVRRKVVKAEGPERLAPAWHEAASGSPVFAGNALSEGIDRKWLAPKLDPRADAEQIVKVRKTLERSIDQETPVASQREPSIRDYYRVEDEEGRRYWLFRDGFYSASAGHAPEWYVHGLFS